MRYWTLIIALLWGSAGYSYGSSQFHFLDVDYIGFDASQFRCNREPMTPLVDCADYEQRGALQADLRLLEVGYWNNYFHTETVESRVRTVGWQYEAGVHFSPSIDIFYAHHSRHIMEGEQPEVYDSYRDQLVDTKFPVEDSYGIRFRFYVNDTKPDTLFK